MRTFSITTALVIGITAVSCAMSATKAQERGQPRLDINILNCGQLKGKPLICVVNETDTQVTDVDCQTTGFFGGKHSKGITAPRGGIPPHSGTIIDAEGCKGTVIFTMLGGQERQVPNVDTNNSVRIDVPKK